MVRLHTMSDTRREGEPESFEEYGLDESYVGHLRALDQRVKDEGSYLL